MGNDALLPAHRRVQRNPADRVPSSAVPGLLSRVRTGCRLLHQCRLPRGRLVFLRSHGRQLRSGADAPTRLPDPADRRLNRKELRRLWGTGDGLRGGHELLPVGGQLEPSRRIPLPEFPGIPGLRGTGLRRRRGRRSDKPLRNGGCMYYNPFSNAHQYATQPGARFRDQPNPD